MSDIISYIQENGHLAFDEMGFNEVDSLILSQLAYVDFSIANDVPAPFGVTLREMQDMGLQPGCPTHGVAPDKCQRLFDALEESRRFRDVAVDFYISDTDPTEEKQFSAVTFRLSPRLHYIAFRGTDSTVHGWKEDFNMSYQADIPSQKAALQYLQTVARTMQSNFILGGHSKGGNLAVYAAMSAPAMLQDQIALIYDHDGPGFRPEMLERPGFKRIENRICKTVPESAVVGLLLTEHEKYTVVKSRAVSLLQHDPFTWRVEDGHFLEAEDTDFLSKFTDRTLTDWLAGTDDDTRRIFVDSLFGLIQSTGAHNFSDLADNIAQNAYSVAAAIYDMEPAIRKLMLRCIRGLLRASGRTAKGALEDTLTSAWEGISQTRERIRKLIEDEIMP